MLKALELCGFKSFADRTRFDFPDGITVVVGPNGSGKSNIVDAMKWVLGSQSAKSLRGQDMSDVIFKGSADRKPAGAAEATIVFDNEGCALPIDAPEVHVTRRVYRSGESEYLINGTPCRLKDVRDLLRGTGVGVDAYSLIEQGKVDRMLQASARDRRIIFEEAAGISRFKAKRVEAERRLARVDQNLTRLSDIVDEVAGRLESLKNQASKAERYRKQSNRLRELRTQLAWTDAIELASQLDQLQIALQSAEAEHVQAATEHQTAIDQRQQWEMQLQQVATRAQELENRQTDAVRQIASFSASSTSDTQTRRQIDEAMQRRRVRLLALQSQAGIAGDKLREMSVRLDSARAEAERTHRETLAAEETHQSATVHLQQVQGDVRDAEQHLLIATRQASEWENRLVRGRANIAACQRNMTSLEERLLQSRQTVNDARDQVEAFDAQLLALDQRIAQMALDADAAEVELADHRRLLARRRDEASALQGRLHGVTERLGVIEELESRREGVTAGVKQLLDLARRKPEGVYREIVGMAAEMCEVDVHLAPLIDVALGNISQYLIVNGSGLAEAVAKGSVVLPGRVGLIRMDRLPKNRPGDRIRLDGLQGVVGRADKLVRCEKDRAELVRHLLGTTWLVDTLESALRLSRLCGAGLRFVTARCELLDRDGSMILGPAGAAAGLVSRRSELIAARHEQEHYRYQLAETEAEVQRLVAQVDQREAHFQAMTQTHRQAVTSRAAEGARLTAAQDRLERAVSELNQLQQQHAAAEQEVAAAHEQVRSAESELLTCQSAVASGESKRNDVRAMADEAQAALSAAAHVVMRCGMEKSRAEQRLETLEATASQLQRDQHERRQAAEEVRTELATETQRCTELDLRILRATSQLAQLHLDVEACHAQLRSLAGEMGKLRAKQRGAQKIVDKASAAVNSASAKMHEAQRALENCQIKRKTLVERIREDYALDLETEQRPEDFQPVEDRAAAEEEIARLREALQNSGSVNMEALKELEELQGRYDTLHGQYQDLTAAKQSLERVIQRINTDSRRLFLETLEAIRTNFQLLYRKSFGGGSADLVLEESEDPLEAGVEILATPPGKSSFSNSLLSGGEKALTAVALLMAIFQFRPSPFCVLDEVDAPFDEANIGRFVTVLHQFLDRTKFVVVTHSKKTMTAATTLYGVTMQESGISTKVSVKFEEAPADGESGDSATRHAA